jgi:hypothetical protein
MVAIIVFVVLLALLGAAVFAGRTADSRDPEYGLGRVIDPPVHPVGR